MLEFELQMGGRSTAGHSVARAGPGASSNRCGGQVHLCLGQGGEQAGQFQVARQRQAGLLPDSPFPRCGERGMFSDMAIIVVFIAPQARAKSGMQHTRSHA